MGSFTRSNFFIKLKSWEYWPFGIIQFPIFIYFAWLALKSRSLVFFSASNPGITMGGMFGESKFEVIRNVPVKFVPKTILVNGSSTKQQVLQHIQEAGIEFPMIFKPDLGERGFMVKKVKDEKDIVDYLSRLQHNFIVQDLVSLPLEFGVFYTRFPNQPKGQVTSVVMKEMLAIVGDGKSSVEALILGLDRARLRWASLKQTYSERLGEILRPGEKIELVSIGNHCLGTKFLDGSHLINQRLSDTFDKIAQQIPGFYFGRFDLRCKSVEDLYEGRILIMELNGCGAEPAHIYQPGYPLTKAMKVLFKHWENIFIIARENGKQGIPFTSLKQAMLHYKKFKAATSIIP